jgi:hypothetical protein
MTPLIDWDDSEARLDLLCRIGPARYNALLRKHQRARVVATVNGYRIRPVVSERFGTVFMVDGGDFGGRSRSCGGGTAAYRGGDWHAEQISEYQRRTDRRG